MDKLQTELEELIRLGKKSGNMRLKNTARYALFAYLSDDGTPGLWNYLWNKEIVPNLKQAREIASVVRQNMNVVNTAGILGTKRNKMMKCKFRRWTRI